MTTVNQSFTEQLFTTSELPGGMMVVTHSITGDTKVFGGATGIPREHAEYWKRNYTLPILGSFHSGTFPIHGAQIEIKPIAVDDLKKIRLVSNIQDATFEQVIGSIYGKEIPYSKQPVRLGAGQSVIVTRYVGPYLAEGATTMPPGARMYFYVVRVMMEYQDPITQQTA